MAIVYILRIRWLLKFKASRERQAPSGSLNTSSFKGIVYSWANIAMPSSMETPTDGLLLRSVRDVSFSGGRQYSHVLCHSLCAGPDETRSPSSACSRSCLRRPFAIGCYRLYRRISHPAMRLMSTPDDIFSLVLLTPGRWRPSSRRPTGRSWGRASDGLLHPDGFFPDLCAVQQDFPLSVLSVHPLLLRENDGASRASIR